MYVPPLARTAGVRFGGDVLPCQLGAGWGLKTTEGIGVEPRDGLRDSAVGTTGTNGICGAGAERHAPCGVRAKRKGSTNSDADNCAYCDDRARRSGNPRGIARGLSSRLTGGVSGRVASRFAGGISGFLVSKS